MSWTSSGAFAVPHARQVREHHISPLQAPTLPHVSRLTSELQAQQQHQQDLSLLLRQVKIHVVGLYIVRYLFSFLRPHHIFQIITLLLGCRTTSLGKKRERTSARERHITTSSPLISLARSSWPRSEDTSPKLQLPHLQTRTRQDGDGGR